jgi:cobalt-zinc-cadmium efflux system outer membrane protein
MRFLLFRPLCAVLAVASLYALAMPAGADPAPSFPELLRQAENAPRLREAQAGVAQAQGLLMQATARPNPTFNVEIENFGGNGPYRGGDNTETTASIEQTIELGEKRGARRTLGAAGVDTARAKAAQTRADFAFDLARAYAEAEASELRLQLAKNAKTLAQEDARIANALVKAGKEPDLRSIQANATADAAQATIDQAQAEREEAFAKLTALVDQSAPITSIAQSLLDHARTDETPPTIDPLASPAYLVARAERDQVRRQIRVEQARTSPDVTVSLGVRRLAGDDANAFVGGVSVPFPIFDRNRGNVAAAQSDLSAAEERMNIARLDAQAQAQSAAAHLRASVSRVRAAQSNQQAASEAYRLTRIGYEGGKLPQSELVTARRAVTEARELTITAKLERLSAEAALARLQGIIPFGDAS